MTQGGYDFAVCGSTAFAGLVAGLLATVHGKRVCQIGEAWSPYRLVRRFDLSVMPVTRPETWALLKREGAETLKVVSSIGRGLYERVDPLFVAETRAGADRLGHMRWIAAGFGFAAERAVDRAVTEGGTICRIRDGAMLVAGKIEPAIETWLTKLEVRRIGSADATISSRRDGTASLAVNGTSVDVGAVVLADDDAILAHLPPTDRHRLMIEEPATSILTEPARPLSAALVHYLDREVVVHQRAMKGSVVALSAGAPDSATVRVGASLAPLGRLRRSGQSVFTTIDTIDGAPLMGRMGRSRAIAIAGLGASAAFLAPAVARHLAGAASEDERAYFEARDVTKAANRQTVAETLRVALERAS